MKIIFEKEKKGDRCTRIAKRKYDVWPSAYASGAVVKCRQGKIWKGLSEEQLTEEILNIISEELEFFLEKKKPDFKKEKESGLHGWFSRKGGKGGSGWVDCNTCRTDKETGKKTCKTCGRQEGEKRAKYPACRPKPSDCGSSGKGEDWGKKSESIELEEGLLEEDKQYLKNIIISELHKLFEQEDALKKTAEEEIKKAKAIELAAKKEKEAQVQVNSALPADMRPLKQAELKSKIEAEKTAKRAVDAAKKTAAEQVTEEKSNFQKEMEKKGKGWKIRLLTKGKQSAGSAYPVKAPTDRAKSAPPGAGGV
jgi:hypothetical protein